MKHTTKSNEDYLEAILLLEDKESHVKSVKVAEYLGVTKPAVSLAMNDLIARGLIKKESYSDITLTEEGRNVAKYVLQKHELVKKVLTFIGVSDATAEIECCKIEHILSDETIECLKNICKKNNL